MSLGIRTENLKKTYTSAPPIASAGMRMAARSSGFRRKKQATPIVALARISLDIKPGEIFGLLDPQTRLLLWDIIREYHARGKTILITTHNMEEADALCNNLAIVDHGRVIALGTPDELKRSVPGGFLVQLQLQGPTAELLSAFEGLPGVNEVKSGANGALFIYADRGGALVPEIVRLAAEANVGIYDVHISEPSLENLFLHHTGRSLRQFCKKAVS
jgi:ABC-type multidrug transport system ATPase subunit